MRQLLTEVLFIYHIYQTYSFYFKFVCVLMPEFKVCGIQTSLKLILKRFFKLRTEALFVIDINLAVEYWRCCVRSDNDSFDRWNARLTLLYFSKRRQLEISTLNLSFVSQLGKLHSDLLLLMILETGKKVVYPLLLTLLAVPLTVVPTTEYQVFEFGSEQFFFEKKKAVLVKNLYLLCCSSERRYFCLLNQKKNAVLRYQSRISSGLHMLVFFWFILFLFNISVNLNWWYYTYLWTFRFFFFLVHFFRSEALTLNHFLLKIIGAL